MIEELYFAGMQRICRAIHGKTVQSEAILEVVEIVEVEPAEKQGSGTERYQQPPRKPAAWTDAGFDADGFPVTADGQPYFPGRSY